MKDKVKNSTVTGFYRQAFIKGNVSINDLQDKIDNGIELSIEELKAMSNFEHYRLSVLNQQLSEEDFHKKYQQIQVLANLGSYAEFLKEKYNF